MRAQSGMLHHVQQPDRGVFSAEFRGLSIGILVLMTSIALEGMAVTTVLLTAAADLNGLEWYGWTFSVFMLASLVGAIGGGELADRRSPTLAGQLAFAVFAVGLVVAGSAPGWPVLLLARALQPRSPRTRCRRRADCVIARILPVTPQLDGGNLYRGGTVTPR